MQVEDSEHGGLGTDLVTQHKLGIVDIREDNVAKSKDRKDTGSNIHEEEKNMVVSDKLGELTVNPNDIFDEKITTPADKQDIIDVDAKILEEKHGLVNDDKINEFKDTKTKHDLEEGKVSVQPKTSNDVDAKLQEEKDGLVVDDKMKELTETAKTPEINQDKITSKDITLQDTANSTIQQEERSDQNKSSKSPTARLSEIDTLKSLKSGEKEDGLVSSKSRAVGFTETEKEKPVTKGTLTHDTPKSIISDKKASKMVSSNSPSVHFSEIEDERTIRVESPTVKRETALSEPNKDDETFDLKDLSFFDTPVNTQTDTHVSIRENVTKDTKKSEEIDEHANTPQGPIVEINETTAKKFENTMSDKVVIISPETGDFKHLGIEHKINPNQSASDNTRSDTFDDVRKKTESPMKADSFVGVEGNKSPIREVNTTVNTDTIVSKHNKSDISDDKRQRVDSPRKTDIFLNGDENKSPVHGMGTVGDGKQSQHFKDDKTTKSKHIKIKSQQSDKTATSYGYSDDFEMEDFTIEKEKSQLQLKGKHEEEIKENSQRHMPQMNLLQQKEGKDDSGLLIEDISSADLFERKKTKSSIHEKTTLSTSKPDPAYEKHHSKGSIETHTRDEMQTFKEDKNDADKSSPNQSKPTALQTASTNETSDRKGISNPYFTGRLPSFGPDDKANTSKENERVNDKDTNDGDDRHGLKHKGSHTDVEYDTVSETKSTSRIIELIQEINAPAQKFHMSKERPLTPKTPSDKRPLQQHDDTHHTETSFNVTASPDRTTEHIHTRDNTDRYSVEKTNMKVGDINYLTSSMMDQYAKDEAPPSAKFDGLPHMQEISQYNRANKLADVPGERKTQGETHRHDSTDRPAIRPQPAVRHVYSREKSGESGFRTVESTTVVDNHYQETNPSDVNGGMFPNKRSSSENDLKAVVASAKQVYRQQNTPSSSVLPPLTREATFDSQINGNHDDNETVSSFRRKHDASHVLICSNCLHQDSNIESAGFCKECQQYLCGNCIRLHKASRQTKRHDIMTAYCVKELEVNKHVKATGYCVDCQHFLCMKCVVLHTGYRANRYHRIIQSSFISKPNKKQDRSPRAEVHPSFTENTKVMERSERDRRKSKERKRILKDLDQDNPYRTSSVAVSDSIYPGPDKKIAISYADNPKWPQASVPKLPYLVKPKSLQERAFQTPYVSYQKSAFYTNTKEAFDPNKVKLRTLQSRYTANSEQGRRTHRRKEEGLFTARRERGSDGVSLPDIHSKPTVIQPQKQERHETKMSRLKKAKLLKEYCISVPFPSGEHQADILSMACLPNGKVLIADKHNNNVKLYNKQFKFKAMVKFSNRLVDICSSNLCPVDVYVATQKHLFEITTMRKGLEVKRKIKVDIKRIEGVTCWKYGLAVVYKKTNLTWEVKLMDYRGNSKSKLEILNPFTQDIDSIPLSYITTIKGGKRVILTDTKNACMICTDVTSRCVLYETSLPDDSPPSYVTSDNEHNVYVSCTDKIQQLSKEGNNVGTIIRKPDEVKAFGCILYNRSTNLMYVQTAKDFVSVYQMA